MKRDYVDRPNSNDVVFQSDGRVKMKQHLGNKRFGRILQARLLDFERDDPSKQKEIASRLYLEMQTMYPPIRFLRRDSNGGKFFLLSPLQVMANIQKALVGMMEEGRQQNKTSSSGSHDTHRIRSNVIVLGEIDPNRIVDLTNDESPGEKNKKKELFSPKLASSKSKHVIDTMDSINNVSMDINNCDGDEENPGVKCNLHPILSNGEASLIDTPKSPESHSRPYPNMAEISLIHIEEEDLLRNDILYTEEDQEVEVEIGNDAFQQILIANFEVYQKNRDGLFSQEQFQTKCLRDLYKQDPHVRFLRYDGTIEKYLEWDPSEALDMIRQAMEERFAKRANEQKSLTDDNSGPETTISIQQDPTAASQHPTTSLSPNTWKQEPPEEETPPQFADSIQADASTTPFTLTRPQVDSKDPNQHILPAATEPSQGLTAKGLEPTFKRTPPKNVSGEHIGSTSTLQPKGTSIGSLQKNNGLISKADESPLPPEVLPAPLKSTDKVGTTDGPADCLVPMTTTATFVMKEADDACPLGPDKEDTLHDH